MFRTRIAVASAAAGVCVLATSACTTSGTDESPTTGSSATATRPTSGTDAPDFPSSTGASTPTTDSSSADADSLSAALLTPSDVNGFTTGKVDGASAPLPCTPDAPPLQTQDPPENKADATLVSDTGESQFKEGIYTFAGAAEAQSFIADASKGFDCTTGTLGSVKARIVGPYKPKVTASNDQNVAWDAGLSDGSFATLSLTRVGDKVIGLVFQATKAGQREIAPPKVIELALEKLAATG